MLNLKIKISKNTKKNIKRKTSKKNYKKGNFFYIITLDLMVGLILCKEFIEM